MGPFLIDYFLSSRFAKEYSTEDISDWYGTCCSSASSLILSRIGRGMRILITQSDLLNALYAAYSRNSDSMFIINNCCITFGICNLLYMLQYTGNYKVIYHCKYNCQYKYIGANIGRCNYFCADECIGYIWFDFCVFCI